MFNGILFYLGSQLLPKAKNMPIWRTDGVVITILLHTGVVEFLYYWLHRALHHHFLYSRYHSHHHSSIVTEPITCKPSPISYIYLYIYIYIPLQIVIIIIIFCENIIFYNFPFFIIKNYVYTLLLE